jgi:hypothetical protein
VLNRSYPPEEVIGAHIWKHATHGVGLDEFGLHESSSLLFRDVQGRVLQCPAGRLPFRRLLAWHAIWTLHKHDLLEDTQTDPMSAAAYYLHLSFSERHPPQPAKFPAALAVARKIPRHLIDPMSTASADEASDDY